MKLLWYWSAVIFCALLSAQGPTAPTGTIELDGRVVHYAVRGGFAVVAGDVLLGPIEEVERLAREQSTGKGDRQRSAFVTPFSGTIQRWPDATIYYTIDSDVPDPQRILSAVDHWNSRSRMMILPRQNQPNYVRFHRSLDGAPVCSSFLGMRGGEQMIETPDLCTPGALIHELGHAFGLLHEQQRSDRHAKMTVFYANIDKRYVSAFESAGGVDAGFYDYGSIMHYAPTAFSRDGSTSLETVPPGIPIGQDAGLSAGDLAAVAMAYGLEPEFTTITSVPEGIVLTVDGVTGTTPIRLDWAPGSAHRIAAPVQLGNDPLYVLASWSDGGAADHTVTARNEAKVYSAAYQIQHRATASVGSGQGSVTVLPRSANGYYPERSLLRVKAEPGPGHVFDRWTGTTDFISNRWSNFQPEATLEVTARNLNYVANFVTQNAYTVETVPPGTLVAIAGVSYYAPVRLNWQPGSVHTLRVNVTNLEGFNSRRQDFQQWEDGIRQPSHTIRAGETGSTYRATFVTKYPLTLSAIGAGTVTANPAVADGFYEAGSTVAVTAVPQGALVLRSWLGDLKGAQTRMYVTMDEQKVITAEFAAAIPVRILHSATYMSNSRWGVPGTGVTPGEIVTLFGPDIGPAQALEGRVQNGKVETSLGGVTLTFDGVAAPLIYVSQNQISAVVPYGTAGSPTTRLFKNGVNLAGLVISSEATAPGLYTANSSGQGMVAALNQDGSVHSATNPAAPGSVIVLYATGAGELAEPLADGLVTGSAKLVSPRAPVFVKVGKQHARVLYAGTAPGLVNGVLQVNVQLPEDLPPGDAVPIQLAVGGTASQLGTFIAVR